MQHALYRRELVFCRCMKMSKKLLEESGSSDEDEIVLPCNKDYAERYENWRRKEELQKLKDKYGEQILSESSEFGESGDEDDSSEEEDEPEIKDVFDAKFFEVFGALKRKDRVIYDKNVKFFDEKEDPENATSHEQNEDSKSSELPKEKKSKALTLKDYHVKLIKEKKGVTEEDENQDHHQATIGYFEELGAIKNELKAALSDNDDDDCALLKTSKKSTEQKGSRKDPLDEKNNENISFLKSYWSDRNAKLEENEKFLRDYIMNKRYLEDEEIESEGPEPTSSNRTAPTSHKKVELTEENEDYDGKAEDEPENTDTSEDKALTVYKYHFEEPDATIIKRYPRSLDSVRDVTSIGSRAAKRVERKERKRLEKETELQRLRELKRAEIRQKIDKLVEASNNNALKSSEIDVDLLVDDDTDFDPDKYDEKMSQLFDNAYYGISEKDKPKFDFVPGIDDMEDDENIEDLKLRKKKTKHDKAPASKKNVGIFEDLIGKDLPTRFKYRTVPANDFGLTSEELLFATDQELNKWVSLKKVSSYRTPEEETYDIKDYEKKRNLMNLKRKIFKSIYEERAENEGQDEINEQPESSEGIQDSQQEGKRKKKRKRKTKTSSDVIIPEDNENDQDQKGDDENDQKDVNENDNVSVALKEKVESRSVEKTTTGTVSPTASTSKRKRNRKRKNKTDSVGISVDRLKAYGLTNRQLKKQKLS